jgi:hypothetical protein
MRKSDSFPTARPYVQEPTGVHAVKPTLTVLAVSQRPKLPADIHTCMLSRSVIADAFRLNVTDGFMSPGLQIQRNRL